MNFKQHVFALFAPPSNLVSVRLLKNREQYAAMLEEAKQRGLLLYSALADWRDKQCYAKQPWVLDMESIPSASTAETPAADTSLKCPICGKTMGTSSGRTLHVKQKHADQYDAYLQSLK
jgi:hypothetical protein